MEHDWKLMLSGVLGIVFLVQFARLTPTAMGLVRCLKGGLLQWPGPPISDVNRAVARCDSQLGQRHFLYPYFFYHYAWILFAAMLAMFWVLNAPSFWAGIPADMETVGFGLSLAAIVGGGGICVRRAVYAGGLVSRTLGERLRMRDQCTVEAQAAAIRGDIECEPARLDDLLFRVPSSWQHRKVSTGHWVLTPVGVGSGLTIRGMFFNVGEDRTSSVSDLMGEVQEKAKERQWSLKECQRRKIGGRVDGIDVVAEARNGVSHRFVNFCYNGLEYFFEIKANNPSVLSTAKPVFDAWIEGFSFR